MASIQNELGPMQRVLSRAGLLFPPLDAVNQVELAGAYPDQDQAGGCQPSQTCEAWAGQPLRLTLVRTTVPGLEPGSDDCGKAGYHGSNDDAQCANDGNYGGVRNPEGQGGHSSPALPGSRTNGPGGGGARGMYPSSMKFPVRYTYGRSATTFARCAGGVHAV
jgi:hypothetical protein